MLKREEVALGGPKSNTDVIEKKPDSSQWCVRGKWKAIKTTGYKNKHFQHRNVHVFEEVEQRSSKVFILRSPWD